MSAEKALRAYASTHIYTFNPCLGIYKEREIEHESKGNLKPRRDDGGSIGERATIRPEILTRTT